VNRSWILAAALLAAPQAPPLAAQQRSERSDREFRWEGSIPSGRWLYVRNLNGSIRVERASGSRVEVTAEKRWRRGDPEDVRIETRRVGSGEQDVVICALWFDNTECDEDGYRSHDNRRDRDRDRNNDVSVEFVVRLPAGVKVEVSTVNGGLQIDGASSEVDAHTVNGRVVANSSGGPVNAGTVNGDIEVRMGSLGSQDLSFETVNGSIEIVVPDANLDADVDMRTINGQVVSDFPMTVRGRINPRHIRATIGRGGRRIELRTVNGSVELRKP
jgi:hypothetical protein